MRMPDARSLLCRRELTATVVVVVARTNGRLGLLMMCVGEMGNFSAFSFAPASLIAPLGCVSVVSNITVAHFLLKERMRPRDILGTVLALVAATGIVIIAPSVRHLRRRR